MFYCMHIYFSSFILARPFLWLFTSVTWYSTCTSLVVEMFSRHWRMHVQPLSEWRHLCGSRKRLWVRLFGGLAGPPLSTGCWWVQRQSVCQRVRLQEPHWGLPVRLSTRVDWEEMRHQWVNVSIVKVVVKLGLTKLCIVEFNLRDCSTVMTSWQWTLGWSV